MVRYTVDEWETVNDVLAWYDGNREGWDRFKFSISLGAQGLRERVMWLVGKYAGGAGEGVSGDAVEWWDNNEGKNYRVGFKEIGDQEERAELYKRGVAVSAPGMSVFFFCQTLCANRRYSDLHQSHTHFQTKTIRSPIIVILIFSATSTSTRTRKGTRKGKSPASSSRYPNHICEIEEIELEELCRSPRIYAEPFCVGDSVFSS